MSSALSNGFDVTSAPTNGFDVTSVLTNYGLPALAVGAVGAAGVAVWYSGYAGPALQRVGSVLKKYGSTALAVGAAAAVAYYGYTIPALATIGGLFCAYKTAEWFGLTKKRETTLVDIIRGMYRGAMNPHLPEDLETAALITAAHQKREKVKEYEKQAEALQGKADAGKKSIADLRSLWGADSSAIKQNAAVQEVLERGPAKKTSSLKSSSDKSLDVNDLAEQFAEKVRKKKFFDGIPGLVRPTWKPHEVREATLKELEELVGADEGQISKADKDAVWKKIGLEFSEF